MKYLDNGLLVVFRERINYSLVDSLRSLGVYCEPVIKGDLLGGSKVSALARGVAVEVDAGFFSMEARPYIWFTFDLGEPIRNTVLSGILTYCDKVGIERNWGLERYIENVTADLRTGGHYVISLSGGIDSSVLAVLTQQVTGLPVDCVFVDTGLGRPADYQDVVALSQRFGNLRIHTIDLHYAVLERLRGLTVPEDKKKTVKECFVAGLSSYLDNSSTIPHGAVLLHGTLLEDRQMLFDVGNGGILCNASPLRCLLKREVRELAVLLGVGKDIIGKLPFSSWGYSRKILGEVTAHKLDMIRQVDGSFVSALHESALSGKLDSADVHLLPYNDRNLFLFRVCFNSSFKFGNSHSEELGAMLAAIARTYPFVHKCLLDCSYDKVSDGYD